MLSCEIAGLEKIKNKNNIGSLMIRISW